MLVRIQPVKKNKKSSPDERTMSERNRLAINKRANKKLIEKYNKK